jgi:hypothetical protein
MIRLGTSVHMTREKIMQKVFRKDCNIPHICDITQFLNFLKLIYIYLRA